MLQCITAQNMYKVEKIANETGVSYYDMMLEAGTKSCEIIIDHYHPAKENFIILCGTGNNGGDGFALANQLYSKGLDISVALPFGQPTSQTALQAYKNLDTHIPIIDDFNRIVKSIESADFVVDAIFGIGFHDEINSETRQLFLIMENISARVISLDIPSGVVCDTGLYKKFIKADLTIAMGLAKPAHLVAWSSDFQNSYKIAELSLSMIASFNNLSYPVLHQLKLPKRLPWGHKGNNGKVSIVAGNKNYTGAALLACQSALHSGAGYVHLISTPYVCSIVSNQLPEVIFTHVSSDLDGGIDSCNLDKILSAISDSHSVLLGCGMGNNHHTSYIVRGILSNSQLAVILDADGLNSIADDISIFQTTACQVTITPHVKEFLRLAPQLEKTVTTQDLLEFANHYSLTMIYKSAITTIVSYDEEVTLSFMGNHALARGGSGDLLAGLVATMVAQDEDLFFACKNAVYLQGRAVTLACNDHNPRYITPTVVMPYISTALDDNIEL